MCVRCKLPDRRTKDAGPLHLCPHCASLTRIEVRTGLGRLSNYLAAWAAFDAWLAERGDAARAAY